jgi:hypothetical protein
MLPYRTEGDLLTVTFAIVEDARAGRSPMNLRGTLGPTTTALFDNQLHSLVLNPALTNSAADRGDGLVKIKKGKRAQNRAAIVDEKGVWPEIFGVSPRGPQGSVVGSSADPATLPGSSPAALLPEARVAAVECAFAQIGSKRGADTERFANRWEPLEDVLSLLADHLPSKSTLVEDLHDRR